MKHVKVTITYDTEIPDDGWVYDVRDALKASGLPVDAYINVHYPSGVTEGISLSLTPPTRWPSDGA